MLGRRFVKERVNARGDRRGRANENNHGSHVSGCGAVQD
jgi:hypothetical protein